MTDPPTGDLLGFAVAIAIGFIIGIERERRKGHGPGRGFAGVRTFALAALMGAVTAFIGGTTAVVVGAALVALLAISAYLRSLRTERSNLRRPSSRSSSR